VPVTTDEWRGLGHAGSVVRRDASGKNLREAYAPFIRAAQPKRTKSAGVATWLPYPVGRQAI
jgi:hypothetical protein